MDSEKEARLVKKVGVVSAIFLVVLLSGISYFIVINQQPGITLTNNTETEEPIRIRDTDARDAELLFIASEMARDGGERPFLYDAEPLAGSPGVFRVNLQEQEVHEHDADAFPTSTVDRGVPAQPGVIIKK